MLENEKALEKFIEYISTQTPKFNYCGKMQRPEEGVWVANSYRTEIMIDQPEEIYEIFPKLFEEIEGNFYDRDIKLYQMGLSAVRTMDIGVIKYAVYIRLAQRNKEIKK